MPVINALSDKGHPCQVLADLMTLRHHFPSIQDLNIV
ncbi:MAG: ornithine carbamoyltransferase, partial [Proteobacteria bacterium]|nr:ornithine carbamoyltransferase [Pseudomonadota bacterium]